MKKTSKIIIFILILLFYSSILIHTIKLPATDDLPRQIKIGEMIMHGDTSIFYKNIFSYAEPDQNFTNTSWLSSVVFYLVQYFSGWNGLVIFKVIILLSTFSLLFWTALKKSHFWLVAFFSLPAIFILQERTGLRPEVFSYLFIAVYLYLLFDLEEHPESKKIFWLIPLQLLWVNTHVFFSIGIMLAGGFLFEKIIMNFKSILIKKLLIVFLCIVAVSFINPRGIQGVIYRYPANYPVVMSENQSIMTFLRLQSLEENIPITLFIPLAVFLALSFILYFVFRGERKPAPIFLFLASAATAVVSSLVIRGLALFGIIFFLAVSANFQDIFVRMRDWLNAESPKIKNGLGIMFVAGMIFTLIYMTFFPPTIFSRYREFGIGLSPSSLDSEEFFKAHGLKGPIFNDADIGSYLIYSLYPQEKVFTDNRFGDAYSASFFGDIFLPMLKDEKVWQTELAKYNFNTIFFFSYDNAPYSRIFLWNRMRDPAWSLVYADKFAIIMVRNIPQNEDIINSFKITPDNIGDKLNYLAQSPNFDDEVAAADMFALMGRDDLAEPEYLKIVDKWPDKGKVWMILGEMAFNRNGQSDTVLAMMFLEKAVGEYQATAETYSFLGATYARMGEKGKAVEALRKALQIDPERKDAQELLAEVEKEK